MNRLILATTLVVGSMLLGLILLTLISPRTIPDLSTIFGIEEYGEPYIEESTGVIELDEIFSGFELDFDTSLDIDETSGELSGVIDKLGQLFESLEEGSPITGAILAGSSEPKTYPDGIKTVTIDDEFDHGKPEKAEFWAPVFLFKYDNGTTWKWGGNIENSISTIEKIDDETIRIYGSGVEFILQPTKGYRKISVDENFEGSDKQKHAPGWQPVQVGDVTEFHEIAPKTVFWNNRGEPFDFYPATNIVHYHSYGNVTLKRDGKIYEGVGSFQHMHMDNSTTYTTPLGYQDGFHVYTDKFIIYIMHIKSAQNELQDGMIYWLDDGSYDVLGSSVNGYLYEVDDGAQRLSYHILVESHKGMIEVDLTESTHGEDDAMTYGFQQTHWAGVDVTLNGEKINGNMAASETIRSIAFAPTSNSWIMDKTTIEDEKPKQKFGGLQWWAWYAYTSTEDKTNELVLNANIYPRAGHLNGTSYTLNGSLENFFLESYNWNEETNTLYGTMKRESDGAVATWSLNFPEDGYRVYEHEIQDEILKIEMWSGGIPLWGARTEDEMLQIGWRDRIPVYGGGFHDAITVKATLTRDGETLTFDGLGMYARAWKGPIQHKQGEAVIGFVNSLPEYYINFMHVRNPFNLEEDFVKQGRIGFLDEAYRFDNFTVRADYFPHLEWFEIEGTYEKGKVDLRGENKGWLHDKQKHPVIRWQGMITRDGEIINVDAFGSGEFRPLETPLKPPLKKCSVRKCDLCTKKERCNLVIDILKELKKAKIRSDHIKQRATEMLSDVDLDVRNELNILIGLTDDFSAKIIETGKFIISLNPDSITQNQIEIGKAYIRELKNLNSQIDKQIEKIIDILKYPYPREPTLKDELPSLPEDCKDKKEIWWYSGTLKEDNDKTYVLRLSFDSSPSTKLLFGEFNEEGLKNSYSCISGFDFKNNSESVILNCSTDGGKAIITITPPDDSHISIEVFDKYTLNLNFKSRGLPFWHGNGKGDLIFSKKGYYIHGFEDLSSIEGTFYNVTSGKIVELDGQGVHLRARWDKAITEEKLMDSNWLPVHFDQGYAFIFTTRDEYGHVIKEAAVSINGEYGYVDDLNKVRIVVRESLERIEEIYVEVDTEFGTLKITGENNGKIDKAGINWLYDFVGEFIYKNGNSVILTGGNGWDGYRLWVETFKELYIDKTELVNSLEYLREQGFAKSDAGEQSASIYVITKAWLESPIENKQEIIDYFDSQQRSDGAWGERHGKRAKAAMRILMAYHILNATPEKSLDTFFEDYDTWEEVKENYDGTRTARMDKYHLVYAWAFYYKEFSPWMDELFDFYEQRLDWTTGSEMHERTHILYSYILAREPFPNADDIIDTTLEQQDEDGGWRCGEYSDLHETSIQSYFLSAAKLLYPDRETEMQSSIEKSKPFIYTFYKTRVENGKTLGYFEDTEYGPSDEWNLHFGILGAITTDLVDGNADPLFDELYKILKPHEELSIEDENLKFEISEDGSWEIFHKDVSKVWKSGSAKFGRISLYNSETGETISKTANNFENIETTENSIIFTYVPMTDVRITFKVELVGDGTIRFSYSPEILNPKWSVKSVGILDEALTISGDNDYAVVPAGFGVVLPASTAPFTLQTDQTYDNARIWNMALLGLVDDNSAVALTWNNIETGVRVVGTGTTIKSTIVLNKDARDVKLHFIANGDYVDIAKYYRGVAKERGLFITLKEKAQKYPNINKLAGAVSFETVLKLGLADDASSFIVKTFNDAGIDIGRGESVVLWTADETASIAEHLKNDLEIEKAAYSIRGWMKGGNNMYTPEWFPIDDDIGGESGLTDACSRIKSLDYLFNLWTDFIVSYKSSGLTNPEDARVNEQGKKVEYSTWPGGPQYDVCPEKQIKYAEVSMPQIRDICSPNAGFFDVVTVENVPECFSPDHPSTHEESIKTYNNLAEYVKTIVNGPVGGEDGYEWSVASFDMDYGKLKFDSEKGFVIPLYELVYRETVMLNTHKAVKISVSPEPPYVGKSDLVDLISVGRTPNFKFPTGLYYETEGVYETNEVYARADSGWAQDFSTTDRVIKNAYEITSPLNELTIDEEMTNYKFITSDRKVIKTTFSNGYTVLVNKRDNDYTYSGITLPKRGFIISGPEFIAFRAKNYNHLSYSDPPLFTVRSLDEKNIENSEKIRIYHGFGDKNIAIKNTHQFAKIGTQTIEKIGNYFTFNVEREAIVDFYG